MTANFTIRTIYLRVSKSNKFKTASITMDKYAWGGGPDSMILKIDIQLPSIQIPYAIYPLSMEVNA